MTSREPQYSKSQIKKAGRILRKHWTGEQTATTAEVERALTIVEDWRACHAYPLTKARMALAQRLPTVGVRGDVGQRLKRTARIIPKLARYPAMQLTTMQDIGGCRAVVPRQADVQAILHGWRVVKNRATTVDDYVSAPRTSGYRAIHVVVEYDGRPIEMQLRTRLQHDWAYTVETWGGRLGIDLKSGEGPQEALDFLAALSDAMAVDETGRDVPAELLAQVHELGRQFVEATRKDGGGL